MALLAVVVTYSFSQYVPREKIDVAKGINKICVIIKYMQLHTSIYLLSSIHQRGRI